MMVQLLLQGKLNKGVGSISVTALLSKNGRSRADVGEMAEAVQAVNVPERQLFKALKDALFRASPVNKYVSQQELIQGKPAIQYPVEEDSKYLEIFKTHSNENLEAILQKNPEAAESTFLLWGIEHFSTPEQFPEIYIADQELMLMKYRDIITPFASHYLEQGGCLNVLCGPRIVHGQGNAITRLFEQGNNPLQMFYYTSGKENMFENLRYAIAGFDIYFETTVPGNGFASPIKSGSIKNNFWVRDELAENYRRIAAAHSSDRLFLTPKNYKKFLPRIEPHAE